jgi:hypothetical protein
VKLLLLIPYGILAGIHELSRRALRPIEHFYGR